MSNTGAAAVPPAVQAQGQVMLKGKFSSADLQSVMAAVADFKTSENVSDEDLCPGLRENRKLKGNTSSAYRIWSELNALLPNRTPKSIYQAVQRQIRKTHMESGWGIWKEEDLKQLDALHDRHGTNWALIGRKLSRSGDACCKAHGRFRQKLDKTNCRAYTAEETVTVVDAIKRFSGASSLEECGKVHSVEVWRQVSGLLQEEFTIDQIKAKWRKMLKEARGGGRSAAVAANVAAAWAPAAVPVDEEEEEEEEEEEDVPAVPFVSSSVPQMRRKEGRTTKRKEPTTASTLVPVPVPAVEPVVPAVSSAPVVVPTTPSSSSSSSSSVAAAAAASMRRNFTPDSLPSSVPAPPPQQPLAVAVDVSTDDVLTAQAEEKGEEELAHSHARKRDKKAAKRQRLEALSEEEQEARKARKKAKKDAKREKEQE